jgi:hypothetical protein
MAEETRWAPHGDEPPEQWLPRIARQAFRWLAGPPPEWTEADIVPEGADPICRVCILPYHPLAAICPHCGEIVTRWATLMEPPWIFVWGLGLWRILARARLSRLLCVGLLLSGLGWLGDAAMLWLGTAKAMRSRPDGWLLELRHVPYAVLYFAVAVRMWEAAARAWGSWRLTEDEDTVPTDGP